MREHKDPRNMMIAVLYDEVDQETRERFESAMQSDPKLAEEYRALRETLETVESADLAGDPGPVFWDGVWPEFERRLRSEKSVQSSEKKEHPPLHWIWRPALQVAAVAAMLIIGIFIGKILSEREFAQSFIEEQASENGAANGERGASNGVTPINVSYPYEKEIKDKKQEYLVDATKSSLAKTESVLEDFMKIKQQNGTEKVILVAPGKEIEPLMKKIAILRSGFDDISLAQVNSLLEEIELVLGDIEVIGHGKGAGLSSDEVWQEISFVQNSIDERKLLIRIKEIKLPVIRIKQPAERIREDIRVKQ